MEISSQDDVQALVRPFKALSSNELRRRALEGLVKALTHQQIRELQSAIEEVDLRCDVIAKLPLEISQIILDYLPVHQIFQAQRDSSKWRRILSPAQPVEFSLRDWFPGGDDGLGLRIPEGVSSESIASLKAEHVDAYRTGHAFTYASYGWDSPAPQYVKYAEGIIAWAGNNPANLISLRDLKTGHEEALILEYRANINALAVSSSMVVALSSKGCHVWSMTRKESHMLWYSVSSSGQEIVSVSRESLAIACPIDPTGGERGFKALSWTLKDQRLSRFFVAIPTETEARGIMLDSNGETLLFFYHSRFVRMGAPMRFYYRRTNLDGDVLAPGVIETHRIENSRQFTRNTASKEANGRAVIWSSAKSPREGQELSELILIYYNFRENRLEIGAHMVDGLGRNISFTSHVCYSFLRNLGTRPIKF